MSEHLNTSNKLVRNSSPLRRIKEKLVMALMGAQRLVLITHPGPHRFQVLW